MQKYIWRQFSSNHSSSFTAVGLFLTVEQAEQAATTIQNTLTSIAVWYEEHHCGTEEISPLEYQFVEQYNLKKYLDWNSRLYVWDAFEGPEVIDNAVTTWDRLVFVESEECCDEGVLYWHLMRRLGSTEYGLSLEGEHRLPIRLSITGTAPDETTAVGIENALFDYLEARDRVQRGGWRDWIEQPHCPWTNNNEYRSQLGNEQSTVLRDGFQLRFDLCFQLIAAGLPAFMEYLQAHGCKNLACSLIAYVGMVTEEDEAALEQESVRNIAESEAEE